MKGTAWCRLSRLRVNPDTSLDKPNASTQALWTHFLLSLLPSLSILPTEQLQEKRNGLIHNPRRCWTCPPSSGPRLLPCCPACPGWPHFSTAKGLPPHYSQQLPSEGQIFLQRKNIFISRQSKRSCPTPPIGKCHELYKETLNFSVNSWKPVLSGGPQEKPMYYLHFPLF